MAHGYKDLIVWQRAMELVMAVYALTKEFPLEERYGLSAQMRRAAVSIPSNIAEGSKRAGKKEFRNFLSIALGSGAELETQLDLAERLAFVKKESAQKAFSLLGECMKMLSTLIRTQSHPLLTTKD